MKIKRDKQADAQLLADILQLVYRIRLKMFMQDISINEMACRIGMKKRKLRRILGALDIYNTQLRDLVSILTVLGGKLEIVLIPKGITQTERPEPGNGEITDDATTAQGTAGLHGDAASSNPDPG